MDREGEEEEDEEHVRRSSRFTPSAPTKGYCILWVVSFTSSFNMGKGESFNYFSYAV